MLPDFIRHPLFDLLSTQTMRYVEAVPQRKARGLVKDIYDQVRKDFFINGSITSHGAVPELMAGVWIGGREIILVDDALDRTTKEAMSATVSQVNDCPYCADMLISLVHAGDKKQEAKVIFDEAESQAKDPLLRRRLEWARVITESGPEALAGPHPFTERQLLEAVASVFAFHYINRFSHTAMDGSPVFEPVGSKGLKMAALRWFGGELKKSKRRPLDPAASLDLLPDAELPEDLRWAMPNPRIANSIARWAAVIEREATSAIPHAAREVVESSLAAWDCQRPGISRAWVDREIEGLEGKDRAIAKLALVVAKASYQVDDSIVLPILEHCGGPEFLVRLLSYSAFSAARRITENICQKLNLTQELAAANSSSSSYAGV